jgi:hypothetical protein
MKTWNAYLDEWVSGMSNHTEYLKKIGADRIASLVNAVHA